MTRAEHRLAIARNLLGLPPKGVDVMIAINRLPPAERERLRGQVDWVEAYEIEEGL